MPLKGAIIHLTRALALLLVCTVAVFAQSDRGTTVCKLPNGSNGACSQPGLQIVSGFGFINTSTVLYQPRTGQLVAQFQF